MPNATTGIVKDGIWRNGSEDDRQKTTLRSGEMYSVGEEYT